MFGPLTSQFIVQCHCEKAFGGNHQAQKRTLRGLINEGYLVRIMGTLLSPLLNPRERHRQTDKIQERAKRDKRKLKETRGGTQRHCVGAKRLKRCKDR